VACYCPGVASAAEIREWATLNGFEDVSEQGRLKRSIKDAYDQAHAEPLAADQEPPPAPEYTPDPDPVVPKRSAGPKVPARKPPKITADTRRDIQAKVAIMLTLPATMWAARDPWCGDVAVAQVPAVSEALTDIFCDSPDMVVFFTSAGGQYMKWLSLATAVQPVAATVFAHHIRHSIGQEDANHGGLSGAYAPPDMSAFHAPPVG
jgi:hypothetical protein